MSTIKPVITGKISENARNSNILKTKRILNTEMQAKCGPVFTFSLPGGGCGSHPCPLVSYIRASQTMGRDPKWGREMQFWGRETNGLTIQIYKFL